MWAIASTMIARTVAATMPISSAPLTLRTTSTLVSSRPSTKTSIGQPARLPVAPKLIGRVPARAG